MSYVSRYLVLFGVMAGFAPWLWSAPPLVRETDFPGKIRLACVGDSITFGHLLPERERNSYPARLQALLGERWVVGSFARNGATLVRKSPRPFHEQPEYRDALAFRPDVVVIQLGTNDTKRETWEAERDRFVTDYLTLIRAFGALESKPRLILCRPIPIFRDRGKAWDTDRVLREEILPRIAQVAQEAGLPVIDLYAAFGDASALLPDGVHPNAEGAARMARVIHAALTGQPSAGN